MPLKSSSSVRVAPGLPQLTTPVPADCPQGKGAAGDAVLGQLVYSAYSEASYNFVWEHYSWHFPLPWWVLLVPPA
jgi:hypothetical protein